ncbi:helix-turn-helix domain-containing protein [Tunturiibacter lichenicola]|uniref:helix-turn-helix domain-containing protein n=1 Tax=Tunturiibacter lichenicola TaxID=2051959 RepID=UPI003D9ADFF4
MHELLRQQLLIDLGESSVIEALPKSINLKRKPNRLPKSTHLLSGEDMDARLRSIRRYITPRELAALLHWHPETVYRRIKSGMPAHRDVDAHGCGRRLKIYPPEIADWLRSCQEALERLNQLP